MIQPICDRSSLQAAMDNGFTPKFLFFWGHRPQRPGQVDASCLSQWFPAHFKVGGVAYASAEHFMMAEKARLFGDDSKLSEILACSHPGEAKKHGRAVANFNQEAWAERRFQLVVQGNIHKFSQNPALAEFLLATGNRVLVEASPRDRIWGIGMSKNNPQAGYPQAWRGLNLLGFALMEARKNLPPAIQSRP